ncbi:substrate-binding domain-containing protein [Kineosporia rhizophila]|uniref:LacI family DNA-binding transcriptional regulator n=1 Tax=Kineosporia TaxID=49184 RepID=UPI001E5B1551|nr:substrate-binding domain-containing protein [Kineosporia sp. NBRC 101677]MCE0537451.1 substrate-binding domain-containing protein [Kineosporia rhizophila]GLY17399.1 LacI family transcriptional regulator [Kineosporia sp. NBRC 101677]
MKSEPPARRPTIYDVAKEAGVSHQTVAMVLRGQGKFRPETLQRVSAAIQTLRYRPNTTARALATSQANRIGALVFELQEVGPSKTVQGATQRAAEAGYLLEIVSLHPGDEQAIQRALGLLDRADVAGLLAFAPVDRLLGKADAPSLISVPMVMELEPDPGQGATLSERGMALVAEHLAGLGHRRVAYLGGSPTWLAARRRSEAVRAALAQHGLELVTELAGDWSAASGAQAVRELGPHQLGEITALVCGNDQMALGALLALDEHGIDVPGRISVTGFDGIPESGYLRPPLTTVKVDYARHGRGLVDTLLARIGKPASDPGETGAGSDDTELLIRRSTAPPYVHP